MNAPFVEHPEAVEDLPRLAREYRRRQPENTVLHQVIRENYLSFVAFCEEQDRPLPRFVRREFEKFIGCGVLSEGFSRARCRGCGFDRLVGFS